MKFIWAVDASKHTTEIDDSDLAQYEEGEERDTFIEDCIQEEFFANATWHLEKVIPQKP